MPERPRRPVFLDSATLDRLGSTRGPDEIVDAAHASARALVRQGRQASDPEVRRRLLALVEEQGLHALAELWADRPARSLPGVLWRLYVLREAVRVAPAEIAREYAEGSQLADVAHAVAGVAEPPGPDQVRQLTDAVLTGVYGGDLAVALERAAAFCRVVVAGRARLANDRPEPADWSSPHRDEGPAAAIRLVEQAAALQQTAEDLAASADLWRQDELL